MRIGKYELRQELGHGAMGTVYKAWDTLLERFVAIKLIGGSLVLDEKRKTLFEREAKAIARMSHPNIVVIYDFNYVDQKPYIAMELLTGCNLEDLPLKDELSLAQKLEIIKQVCDGLSHAHQQEVVHRDIKPTNVFVTEMGSIKIMDFGIARLTAGATMTQGTIMGTPEYMSPEQILGEKVDERSDIFGVGILLYWLLKGESPFEAENVQSAFYKILNQPTPNLELQGVEPENLQRLQTIVNRSLAKNTADRYSKASEMANDLKGFVISLRKDQIEPDNWEPYWAKVQECQEAKALSAPAVLSSESHPETRIESTLRLSQRKNQRNSNALPNPPRFSPSGKYAMLGVLIALAIAAIYARYFAGHSGLESISTQSMVAPQKIHLGIASESSKQRWMEPLAQKFEATPEGKNIDIDLIFFTAMESTEAILKGDRRIDVWCPASDLLEEDLVSQWKNKYGISPILSKNELAYTPMVFVIWEDRYNNFITKYKTLNFKTLAAAISEKDGWGTIAKKPEWGLFGFGSTDPKYSNGGLMMLTLLAHEYYRKASALTIADIQNAEFQEYLKNFQAKTRILGNSTSESIQKMLVKGPASIDAAFLPENVAVDYLKDAEGRWGKFHFAYPEYNMWNENPYCILNTPWASENHKQAAKAFLNFLLNDSIQQKALDHGFRPVDTGVAFLVEGSPFLRYRDAGLKVDIGTTCEAPEKDVLHALQESWKKNEKANQVEPQND
jgi:serine/threonine protein kinase